MRPLYQNVGGKNINVTVATYFWRTRKLLWGRGLDLRCESREQWWSEISHRTVSRWRWRCHREPLSRCTEHRPCTSSWRLEQLSLGCCSSDRLQSCPNDILRTSTQRVSSYDMIRYDTLYSRAPKSWRITSACSQFWGWNRVYGGKDLWIGFEPGVKERWSYGWWEWWVDSLRRCGRSMNKQDRDREAGMRLTKRTIGSWLQRQGEEHTWMSDRELICNEDDIGGRASVTRDEERVLRGGWTEMRLMQIRRLGGCEDFVSEWEEFVFYFIYSTHSVILSQWIERRIGVMWQDLGALTTARASEFWICWRRVIWDLGRLS